MRKRDGELAEGAGDCPSPVFRIVTTKPSHRRAFLSHRALGKAPPRKRGVARDSYDGVSAFTTLQAARDKATDLNLGDWIAEIDTSAIELECSTVNKHGHVDLFADPDVLRDAVVRYHTRAQGKAGATVK